MKTTIELPLLPLRDVVVYPHMVIPLFVGREKSIEALEAAMTGDKQILLLAQKNPADDDPGEDALYRVGTIATVLQLLKLPDGTVKVLVEGEQRGAVERFGQVDGYLSAEVSLIDEVGCA
jgi:ATP-dependent Lon protease